MTRIKNSTGSSSTTLHKATRKSSFSSPTTKKVRSLAQNTASQKALNYKRGYRKSPHKLQRIKEALADVDKGISVRKAAKNHGLSASFLSRRVHGEVSVDSRNGPKPVFSVTEEEEMATWLSEMSKRGTGLGVSEFLDYVQGILKKDKRENKFKNDRPSYAWYYSFMARNAHLVDNANLKADGTVSPSVREALAFPSYSNVNKESSSSNIITDCLASEETIGNAASKQLNLNYSSATTEKVRSQTQKKVRSQTQKKASQIALKYKRGYRKSPDKLHRIEEALAEVGKGISVRKAAKNHDLSASFLSRRVHGEVSVDSRNGPKPVFSVTEEEEMATWLSEMSKRGMGLGVSEFLDFVQGILKKDKCKNKFKNDRPSYAWYYAFIARNAHLLDSISVRCLNNNDTHPSAKADDTVSPSVKEALVFPSCSDVNKKSSSSNILTDSLTSEKNIGNAASKQLNVNYKKGFRKSPDKLQRIKEALAEVGKGISVRKAAINHGLSSILLSRRVHGKVSVDSRNGPKPVFSVAEEKEMVTWLSEMSKKGTGLGVSEFLDFVQGILKKDKRWNNFKNDRPSYAWYYAFMGRNAHLVDSGSVRCLNNNDTHPSAKTNDTVSPSVREALVFPSCTNVNKKSTSSTSNIIAKKKETAKRKYPKEKLKASVKQEKSKKTGGKPLPQKSKSESCKVKKPTPGRVKAEETLLSGSNSKSDHCTVCKKLTEEQDGWVQCDICDGWIHVACIPPDHDYDHAALTTENVEFFCHFCAN